MSIFYSKKSFFLIRIGLSTIVQKKLIIRNAGNESFFVPQHSASFLAAFVYKMHFNVTPVHFIH